MASLATLPVIGSPAQDVGVSITTQADVAPLPSGFPASLAGLMSWVGSDFTDKSDYIYVLSEDHLSEISGAVAHFKGKRRAAA